MTMRETLMPRKGAISAAPAQFGRRMPVFFRRLIEPRGRDWAGRIGTAAVFYVMAVAAGLKVHDILSTAAHIDMLTATRLLATFCQLIFCMGFVWFALIRTAPVRRARGWQPRVSAMGGTFLSLGLGYFPPALDLPAVWHVIAALLMLVGTFMAAFIVLPTLGKSFSLVAEARHLVTRGPYRTIRHPLYLVEEIAIFGGFMEAISIPAALLFTVQIALQIRRIYNEETLLEATFPDYARYKASTARLIPGVW